jgi:hypothetical protein
MRKEELGDRIEIAGSWDCQWGTGRLRAFGLRA